MLILSLDTSCPHASAALCSDDETLACARVGEDGTHTQLLLPLIDTLFKSTNKTVSDVDLFALTVGPGSFTGVRVAVSVVKGLAFAKNKPCAPISSLEANAARLEETAKEGALVIPCMDARRNQVYNAIFKKESGRLARLCPDRLISLDELKRELENADHFMLCGDAYALSKDALGELSGFKETPDEFILPFAPSVAKCALRLSEEAPASLCSPDELLPLYLRDSQAEQTKKSKNAQ